MNFECSPALDHHPFKTQTDLQCLQYPSRCSLDYNYPGQLEINRCSPNYNYPGQPQMRWELPWTHGQPDDGYPDEMMASLDPWTT